MLAAFRVSFLPGECLFWANVYIAAFAASWAPNTQYQVGWWVCSWFE